MIKYIGKANDSKVTFSIAKNIVVVDIIPAINGIEDSVSGNSHDFIKVGTVAKKSLEIENIISNIGFSVISQSMSPKIDNKPQK